MISGGHRNHAIEMLALNPQLIFAGSVAGVLAAFKHGDDDNFHCDWFRGRRGLGDKRSGADARCEKQRPELSDKSTHDNSSFGISSDGEDSETILHQGGKWEIEFMASGGRIALINWRHRARAKDRK